MLVGVVGLCLGTVPLEHRQVCVFYFILILIVFVLYFRRFWGRQIREPYYDEYSGLGHGNDISKACRYAKQLS